MLPENVRKATDTGSHWRLWIYGQSYSGKTYLANQFPNVLMFNSDGNTYDAPSVRIANQYTSEGAILKERLAWDVFKDYIRDLKKGSEYETVVIDLVEDFYEFCRFYMYKKLGITHESDDNYRAWDKVRNEFYSTMRDLLSLPYNFILISQEDASRDMSSKSGEKVTMIKPNIADKVAIKLMGMVTVTARVVCEKGVRTIEFKGSDAVFGGGRIPIAKGIIPCEYSALMEVLSYKGEAPKTGREESKLNEPLPKASEDRMTVAYAAPVDNPSDVQKIEKAPAELFETPRKRRSRVSLNDEKTVEQLTGIEETVDCSKDSEDDTEDDAPQTAPAPRRRRVRL